MEIGVVHISSTPASAIKRKYRLVVNDLFEDINSVNCARRWRKARKVRTVFHV